MRSGVDDAIQIMFGDACQIVPGFSNGSFDFIFQDVDKRLYPQLAEELYQNFETGGCFCRRRRIVSSHGP